VGAPLNCGAGAGRIEGQQREQQEQIDRDRKGERDRAIGQRRTIAAGRKGIGSQAQQADTFD
jgi:hypothetical protein